jgi:hypothetical protein
MRRGVILAVAVLALLGVLAPPSFAQAPAAAPAPKVTINGLIDNISVWGNNAFDTNFAARKDTLWANRTRGVFTITGEIGKAKGVLALELDLGWGTVSSGETVSSVGGGATSINSSQGAIGSGQRAFQTGAFDLNNDTQGAIEIKNLYVEFPVPLIPLPTVMRLGGQPANITYKPNALWGGDYGGLWMQMTVTPNLKWNFAFAQAEEDDVGFRANNGFFRGDDYILFTSVDVTPFQGIDIKPFLGWYHIYGNSFNGSRCRINCAGLPANGAMVTQNQFTGATSVNATQSAGTGGTASFGNYRQNSQEERYYFGVDTRMTIGPFYLDPTVIVEKSNVDLYRNQAVGAFAGLGGTTSGGCVSGAATLAGGLCQGFGQRVHQSISSILVDIRGGARIGPLLIEGIVIYTPGDDAQHDSWKDTRVYRAITMDGGYSGSWNEILSPGSVDYFTGNGNDRGSSAGLGRYGRRTIGAKMTYSVTPAFDVNFKATGDWTDTKVDVDAVGSPTLGSAVANNTCGSWNGTLAGSPGAPGSAASAAYEKCRQSPFGDHRFVGVELGPGITYRFAPGLTFDAVYAHLFAGPALETSYIGFDGTYRNRQSAKDADLVAARVRYQF